MGWWRALLPWSHRECAQCMLEEHQGVDEEGEYWDQGLGVHGGQGHTQTKGSEGLNRGGQVIKMKGEGHRPAIGRERKLSRISIRQWFLDSTTKQTEEQTYERSKALILRYSKRFFALALVQLAVVVSSNAASFILLAVNGQLNTNGLSPDHAPLPYTALFVVAMFHSTFLVWDGIRHMNIFQIYGFVVLNLLYLTFGCMQLAECTGVSDSLKVPLVTLSAVSTGTLFLCSALGVYFTLGISNQYRWEMFKMVGNNVELRHRWYIRLWFEFLLKVSLLFGLIFTYIGLIFLSTKLSIMWWLTIGLFVIEVILYVVGLYAFCRNEHWKWAIVYLVGKGINIPYFIILEVANAFPNLGSADRALKQETGLLILLSCVNGTLLVVNLISGIVSIRGFGHNVPEITKAFSRSKCSSHPHSLHTDRVLSLASNATLGTVYGWQCEVSDEEKNVSGSSIDQNDESTDAATEASTLDANNLVPSNLDAIASKRRSVRPSLYTKPSFYIT
eukprot:Nk52_evm8s2391 gene=Nk52_evmTU8s2391